MSGQRLDTIVLMSLFTIYRTPRTAFVISALRSFPRTTTPRIVMPATISPGIWRSALTSTRGIVWHETFAITPSASPRHSRLAPVALPRGTGPHRRAATMIRGYSQDNEHTSFSGNFSQFLWEIDNFYYGGVLLFSLPPLNSRVGSDRALS